MELPAKIQFVFLSILQGIRRSPKKKKSGILVIEIWKAGKGLVLFPDSWY